VSQLNEIKNFGPYMVTILHKIGIHTKEDLLNTDYKHIRDALVSKGIRPHLNIFYSIEMGLQGRVWSDITAQEKKELKEMLQ
jgi:hypothetical protein